MGLDREPDLLSGYAEIGEFLGMTEREAKHLASAGRMPTFKVSGSRIVRARRSTLREWLRVQEAQCLAERAQHAD